MWKKDDDVTPPAGSTPAGNAPKPTTKQRPPSDPRQGQAVIGRSITIRGDVTGDEDLLIQGRVEGSIDLKEHSVTVGPEGRVKADLSGKTVTVEGEVDGDIRGRDQVALRASSKVNGDIVAPRVVLEDGASFLGSIDMSGNASPHPSVVEPATQPAKPAKTGDAADKGKKLRETATS